MDNLFGIDPVLKILLERTSHSEFDYGLLKDCVSEYKNPRVKLNQLLKKKAIIRVKKGIYILGSPFLQKPYCHEVLANMIYGPSYVSLEWASQYYRLIPEKVTTVTSVTTQRSREFRTPIGLYTYDHVPLKAYPVGITLIQFSKDEWALFATKEKAITDLLVLRRGKFTSFKYFKEVVFEDLRLEEEDLRALDKDLLKAIFEARPHSAVEYLIRMQ